jgi:hypothetical protein
MQLINAPVLTAMPCSIRKARIWLTVAVRRESRRERTRWRAWRSLVRRRDIRLGRRWRRANGQSFGALRHGTGGGLCVPKTISEFIK